MSLNALNGETKQTVAGVQPLGNQQIYDAKLSGVTASAMPSIDVMMYASLIQKLEPNSSASQLIKDHELKFLNRSADLIKSDSRIRNIFGDGPESMIALSSYLKSKAQQELVNQALRENDVFKGLLVDEVKQQKRGALHD